MSYIGQGLPADTFQGFTTDKFSGDGTANKAFTLTKEPFSEDTILVTIDGVVQEPTDDFTVSGTTLTLVGTAANGSEVNVTHMGGPLPIGGASELDLNGASDKLILDADADTTISADTDDQIDFKTGGTDRLTVQSTSGNNVVVADGLTLTDGNITFSGSGHGIHLGVTSANAANLLDDYEEGDHVISTHYAGSGSWNTTDSNDTLQYTKIGRLVHVSGRVDVDTYSSASGIGYIDAPFTPSSGSETSGDSTGLLRVAGSNGKNVGDFNVQVYEGLARLYFDLNDANILNNAALAAFDSSMNMYMSITYHV